MKGGCALTGGHTRNVGAERVAGKALLLEHSCIALVIGPYFDRTNQSLKDISARLLVIRRGRKRGPMVAPRIVLEGKRCCSNHRANHRTDNRSCCVFSEDRR